MSIAINPEIKALVRPLSDQEKRDLKTSIERKGIEQPLLVAELSGVPTIVDGHHRYEIARELRLPRVPTRPFEFKTIDGVEDEKLEERKMREVRLWVREHAYAQRNLTPFGLLELLWDQNEDIFRRKQHLSRSKAAHDWQSDTSGQIWPNVDEDTSFAAQLSSASNFPEKLCKRALAITFTARGERGNGYDKSALVKKAKELADRLNDKEAVAAGATISGCETELKDLKKELEEKKDDKADLGPSRLDEDIFVKNMSAKIGEMTRLSPLGVVNRLRKIAPESVDQRRKDVEHQIKWCRDFLEALEASNDKTWAGA